MKSKTVAALAVFAALLITAVAGVALTPAPAAAAPGVITLAGAPGVPGVANGTGTAARFNYARGVAVDANGNAYVADTNSSTIRMITAAGVVTTFAGTANTLGSADGTGTAARFNYPEGVAWDAVTGTLLVADTQNNMIRRITPAGVVTTVTGQLGAGGFGGYVDGNVGVAMFKHLRGIVVDAAGNIFVGDSGNDAVRKITPAGVVSTMAGGLGVFNNPRGVAVDTAGNVYVADFNNHRIARISSAGVVITWAGTGVQGAADGAGGFAQFNNPDGLARSSAGNLYVGDSGNNTIRAISSTGGVTTFAGGPPPAAAGSADGANLTARFNDPRGVAVDTGGNVYVADRGNSTIRKTVANMFTITATAGPNGAITPAGVIGVASGGSITFTITPNANYHIVDVLVGGSSVGAVASYSFTGVTGDHTISATFAATSYTITPSAGPNGGISPSTPQVVVPGSNQAFTITPNAGYHVLDVLVDNGSVGAVTSYTFNNVAANHTISATFEVAPSITITSPTAGTTWTTGSGSIGFTTSAVSVGEFDGFLINTVTGGWYGAGRTAPVAGQTVYTQTFSTAGIPPGTYTAVMYYRPDPAVWGNWQASALSAFGAATIP